MQTEKQSGNAGKSTRNVNQAVDQAGNIAHDTIDRAQATARPAVDNIAASAHETVDRLAGAATNAAYKLDRKGEELRDAQAHAMDQLRAYVNEHPVAALGMAVAGGFLLSRILSSK